MFAIRQLSMKSAASEWKNLDIDEKDKLFRVYHFLYMNKGRSYNIEVQEAPNGDFLAHADNTTDPHDAIKSFHAKDFKECLQSIIAEIQTRE